jgi:hypothetical protein
VRREMISLLYDSMKKPANVWQHTEVTFEITFVPLANYVKVVQ